MPCAHRRWWPRRPPVRARPPKRSLRPRCRADHARSTVESPRVCAAAARRRRERSPAASGRRSSGRTVLDCHCPIICIAGGSAPAQAADAEPRAPAIGGGVAFLVLCIGMPHALAQNREPQWSELLPRIAQDYAALVDDLEVALQRDVDRARGNLRPVLGDVRLTPDPTGEFLIAEGDMQAAPFLCATGPPFRTVGRRGALCSFPSLPFRHRVK